MITAQTVQRGRGKGRNPWLIRAYLSSLGMNMSQLAERAETWPQVAHETVRGTRNHGRTLEVLEKLGCPRAYLYGDKGDTLGEAA